MSGRFSGIYHRVSPSAQLGMDFLSHLRHGRVLEALHTFEWLCKLVQLHLRNAKRVTCEYCGWEGNSFFPYLNTEVGYYRVPNEVCPRCYCKSRYRLLLRYLKDRTPLFHGHLKVLDVGTAPCFRDLLNTLPNIRYVNIDLDMRPATDARMDIRSLAFAASSFDMVFCYHVLEHVQEDGVALRELHRVLVNDGIAFVQVPVDMTLATTVEYGRPRKEEFGHVRCYGRDYVLRLQQAGFRVNSDGLDYSSKLNPQVAKRHGIDQNEPLFVVTKRRGDSVM